jgi:hypothetical protein
VLIATRVAMAEKDRLEHIVGKRELDDAEH